MPPPSAPRRVAGRVILLDRADRVLLVEERNDMGSTGSHWLTPGGGVEGDEVPAQAAVRELFEETGLTVTLRSSVAVHVGRHVWSMDGQSWDQTNYYFLARIDAHAPPVAPVALTELERGIVLGARWWTVSELRASTAQIWPQEIVSIVVRALAVPADVSSAATSVGPPAGPLVRTGGRVLLIDQNYQVLLLEHLVSADGGESVWAAPGGGCESDETPAQAAVRELAEECGIDVAIPKDATADHSERRCWTLNGIAYDQTDHFFVVRIEDHPEISGGNRTELEEHTVLGHRWFSAGELRRDPVRHEPAALADLLHDLLLRDMARS